MNQQVVQGVPEKRGCSPIAMVLIGCGGMMLLGIVATVVLVFFGYRWTMQKVDEFATKYEEQGYEHVVGQMIDETQPINSSRVYTAQIVIIRDDVNADLAIMSQSAEIHGIVDGNIDFLGQILTIKPDAVVKGDIRIEAGQLIRILGTVEGEVTGKYQILDWPDKPAATSTSEDAGPTDIAAEAIPEETESTDATSDPGQ